ncbi:uncharacterized protein PV06_09203 [Exophiala oligosperma]|uniref:HMA domain-containing protein n=1 Tax=Exophiala oligosperma TaxID=215243 RepID=A0A0D2DR25_9EURO|nr:uncharacterized protein PV06_09203 [Exophiala oligosperma]KIW38219.1 hypothetical protein PV06_09203 [Exophiala oligosperma]
MAALDRLTLPPCWTCVPSLVNPESSATARPCCDESCIEKVALRECALQCGEAENPSWSGDKCHTLCDETVPPGSSSTRVGAYPYGQPGFPALPNPSRKRKREACIAHSRSVRNRYSTVLARIGCICKELVAKQLEPCCKEGRPVEKRSSVEQDGCCDKEPGNCYETTTEKSAQITSCSDCCDLENSCVAVKNGYSGPRRNGSCGGRGKASRSCAETSPTNECREGHSGSSYGPGASNAVCSSKGDCCSGPGSRDQLNILPSKNLDIKPAADLDLEQIPSNLEHVILDVQGLTCTGCETKLFRSLHAIPGIFHLQTSLVLSQAEFDLNEKAGSIDEVIKSVEKATGFACQRINNEGQEVDVVVDGDAKVFVAQKYPHGVLQMTAIGHQLVRISYDGRIIGARVLLRECFDSPLKLGAPRRSSELESGKRHVWNMAWITLLSTILTIPVLVMAWAPLPHRPIAYGSASLALATIVQVVVAGPFYPSALRALLFTRVIEIDLLIVLSTSTAYIFSIVLFAYVVVGQPLSIEQFFETSTLLITLIVLGRLVSASRDKGQSSPSPSGLSRKKRLRFVPLVALTTNRLMSVFSSMATVLRFNQIRALRQMVW